MNNVSKFLPIGRLCCLMALAVFSFTSCAPKETPKAAGRYPDRNLAKPDAGDTGIDLAWRAGKTPEADQENEIAVGSTLVVRLRNLDGWLLKKLEDGVISGEPAMSPADKKNFFLYLQIRDLLSADVEKAKAFKNNVVVGAKTPVTEGDVAPKGVTYHDLLTAKIDFNNLLTDVRRGLFLVLNNSQFRQIKAENPDALDLTDNELMKDREDDTLYELEFGVQRLAGDEEAWGHLYDGTQAERGVRVSLGIELDHSVYVLDTAVFPQALAKVQQVRIVLFQRGWLWGVLSGLLVLLFVLLMLSATTPLLRDRDIPLRADGWEQYSLSRLQLAFWTYLVVGAFLIIWLVTERLDTLNSTILALIGISSGTLLASKLANTITLGQGATRADPGRWARREKSTRDLLKELGDELTKLEARAAELEKDPAGDDTATTANDPERVRLAARIDRLRNDLDYLRLPTSMRFFVDVLSEDGNITLHRLQIVIWTVVLGLVFVEQVMKELSMPVFSETLLGLMGLSSATYIALKVPALKKVQADTNAAASGGG